MPFDISPLRVHPESFEHEQNVPVSHKNFPEYLECTQNAVTIFKMQFDCLIFIPTAFIHFIPALVWRPRAAANE